MAQLNLCVDCNVDDHCLLGDPDCECQDCQDQCDELEITVWHLGP